MDQDLILVEKIASGDTGALEVLYKTYKARVYNICLNYLQNIPEAEETLQDIFLEVYHASAKFRGTSKVSTWIYRISINKCLDSIRHRNRMKRSGKTISLFRHDSSEPDFEIPDFHHPGIELENQEQSAQLFRAIASLPENQKTAFIFRIMEDLPQKEIAAAMGLSEKAVESLVQRAKGNLRKILGKIFDRSEGNNNK